MSRKKYRRMLPWEQDAILAAYAAGEKLDAIAMEFDVLESSISTLAKRRGLPRRTTRGPLSKGYSIHPPPKRRYKKRDKLTKQREVAAEFNRAAKAIGINAYVTVEDNGEVVVSTTLSQQEGDH